MAAKAGKAAANGDDGPMARMVTERVVLQRVQALIVPAGIEPKKLADAIRLLAPPEPAQAVKPEAGAGADRGHELWLECGTFTGSKVGAIEAYAGKPGSADAKVGEWRAVPARSWKGGVRHSQPALPKVERELVQ